jgi:hypothetical protein
LRDMIGRDTSEEITKIYGGYLDYRGEIKAVIKRTETEAENEEALAKRIFEAVRRNEEVDEQLLEEVNNLLLLQLDIKSFFIFTKIFLDTLARIIRLRYGEKGKQLSYRMSRLVKNPKQECLWKKLDYDFYKGLKDRMCWMDDFEKTRDEIVHYLGGMRSTETKNGDFGFDILGLRNHRPWGTVTVKSISEYMSKTLSNLTEVISYIHSKLHSSAHTS